jgi:uncharacterized protein YuzE
MSRFKVYYDEEEDILFIGKEGEEEEFVEIEPNLNVELGKGGEVIGIEIIGASSFLKDEIKKIYHKVSV